ncbi:MAG: hypothetical protein EA397_01730 [Deltaproteobacteria bacterium]|nr:MAG: hypothetical protein EA397_01730 [Deltaproteobacteria bacterium]
MIRLHPVLLSLLLAGCPKAPMQTEEPLTRDMLQDTPRLPAPRAGTYAQTIQIPQDPVVRSIVAGRNWDASLAGAAAGLALDAAQDKGGFSRREIREACWQAGYPWPVLSIGVWKGDEKAVPPKGLRAWIESQPIDRDLGVVRARGMGRDTWVALAGEMQIDIGIVPREFTLGHILKLPSHPAGRWRASDGQGFLSEGSLKSGAAIPLDVAGEWILHLFDDEGDLARFAVYVNEQAPRLGVLPVLDKSVNSAKEGHTRAWQLINIARDAYGNDPIKSDPLMTTAAERARDEAKTDLRATAKRFARDPDKAVGWYCEAATIEDCVDRLLWDPTTRQPFVDTASWAGGIAIEYRPGTIKVYGAVAAD